MDLSTITTDDLLAEVARRIEAQTKPESENWPVVNGYEIKPGASLSGAYLPGADLSGVDLALAKLRGADLSEVVSGGISGTPTSLPTGWQLIDGSLVGP